MSTVKKQTERCFVVRLDERVMNSTGMGETAMYKQARKWANGRISRKEVKRVTGSRQASVLKSLSESFGNRDLKNLSGTDIERWMATRGHLALGTRRYELATVRQFTRWLQQQRVITRDPMIHIRKLAVPRRVPRSLTRDELAKLFAALPDPRARAIFALMRWLGLRRCEVLRLQIGDWDRTAETIRVTGKGDHERVVPVSGAAARFLLEYLHQSPATAGPMIRHNDRPRPISNSYIGALMRTWMEAAGIKQGAGDGRACHSLRHTIASEIADVEDDLRVLQELLGHVNLSSTQIYIRKAPISKVRAAMEAAA